MDGEMSQDVADGVLKVVEARMLNPITRLLRFSAEQGAALPAWTPGSHIKVQVALPSGATDWRHYSLIAHDGAANEASAAPADYTIAVRREAKSRGGSAFMHDTLQVGDSISYQFPSNNFPFGVIAKLRGCFAVSW